MPTLTSVQKMVLLRLHFGRGIRFILAMSAPTPSWLLQINTYHPHWIRIRVLNNAGD